MENSIYLALSRQVVLQDNMNIVANNIANMTTSGYRGQNMLFEEFIEDPRGTDDPLSFVLDRGQYSTTAPGSMKYTGNPLDIAIAGPGYIGVQGAGGQIMYSRAGDLQMDAGGILTNSEGRPVASAGGASITIPQGSTEIKIDEKGFVSNQDGQLGQIMLVEFENLQTLEPVGGTLYKTDETGLPPTKSKIKQGQLEGSNVNAVTEMTKMIETLREYQSVQNALRSENDRLRSAIQVLTDQ